MARIRSPNYPAISLPAALDKVRAIHKSEGKNATDKNVLAKALGYSGLNGGSGMILSALQKYGLIESVGDGEAKVTPLATTLLYHETADEYEQALQTAALKPSVFQDIREKWPDRLPSEDSLKSFLVRRNFAEGALQQVIQVYRETINIAFPSGHAQDSTIASNGETPVPTIHQTPPPPVRDALPQTVVSSGRPFSVAFDGRVLTGSLRIQSVRDIDRFVKVLQAQRTALEAMQDEEDATNDPRSD